MSEYKHRFTPQASKTSVIQICRYQDKNMEGTLQNACETEPKAFSNLTQLLFFMDGFQEGLCYPQRGMEPRSFKDTPKQPIHLPQAAHPPDTVLATFKVELLFRQNASWQGNVVWLESGLGAQFRSALELVILMDSVLN